MDRLLAMFAKLKDAMKVKNTDKVHTLHTKFTEAVKVHGTGWGADVTCLGPEELQQLLNGGTLVINDGEYVHYVCTQDVNE